MKYVGAVYWWSSLKLVRKCSEQWLRNLTFCRSHGLIVASLSPDSKDLGGFYSISIMIYYVSSWAQSWIWGSEHLNTAVTLSSSSSVNASGWLKMVIFNFHMVYGRWWWWCQGQLWAPGHCGCHGNISFPGHPVQVDLLLHERGHGRLLSLTIKTRSMNCLKPSLTLNSWWMVNNPGRICRKTSTLFHCSWGFATIWLGNHCCRHWWCKLLAKTFRLFWQKSQGCNGLQPNWKLWRWNAFLLVELDHTHPRLSWGEQS